MTLQVPYRIKLGLGLGTPAYTPTLPGWLYWKWSLGTQTQERKGSMVLGTAGCNAWRWQRSLTSTPPQSWEPCKPGTFQFEKLLPCFLALVVPTQHPPGCKAGTCWARCTQWNPDWDSCAAWRHGYNNIKPFSAQHLPTNRTLRRAAELSARKRNSEKERRKGKESLRALRDREIMSALAQPYNDCQPSPVPISSSASLLHPCSPGGTPTQCPGAGQAWDIRHYSGPWDGLERLQLLWQQGQRGSQSSPLARYRACLWHSTLDPGVLAALINAGGSTQTK